MCTLWTHLKCRNITFEFLGKTDEPYFCPKCYANIFPFHNLTDNKLFNEIELPHSNKANKLVVSMFDENLPDSERLGNSVHWYCY